MFSTVEKQKRDYILLQVLEIFHMQKSQYRANGFCKMCILVLIYVNINYERERESE